MFSDKKTLLNININIKENNNIIFIIFKKIISIFVYKHEYKLIYFWQFKIYFRK